MNGKNEKRDSEVSFEGLVDLGSVPPPAGVVGPDVHAARTAVAALPSSLLEELRRARANEAGDAKRTRKQEKFDVPARLLRRSSPSFSSFANEAPTAPGKEGPRLLRPLAPDVTDIPPVAATENLVAVIEAALVEAPNLVPPPPPAPPPTPVPVPIPVQVERVKTPPMPMPMPAVPMPAVPMSTHAAASFPPPEPQPSAEETPLLRMPFLVAFLFVTTVGLVLTAIAIAERLHR